jgi:hypothetical protein
MASRPTLLHRLAGVAGGPVTSQLIGEFARQTEKVWQQQGGNVHSWHWPDPNTAPDCSVSTFNSETVFNLGDATEAPQFQIPWHTPDGFSRTGAEVWVAKKAKGAITAEIKIVTDDLLANVTKTETHYRPCNFELTPHEGLWLDDHKEWRIAKVTMACAPATFIASRYHTYRFYMQVKTQDTNAWSQATTFDTTFRLFALRLWDLPADRTGLLTGDGE